MSDMVQLRPRSVPRSSDEILDDLATPIRREAPGTQQQRNMVMAALCVDEELDLDFWKESPIDAKVSSRVELQAPDHLPAIVLLEIGEDFRERRSGFTIPMGDASIG